MSALSQPYITHPKKSSKTTFQPESREQPYHKEFPIIQNPRAISITIILQLPPLFSVSALVHISNLAAVQRSSRG